MKIITISSKNQIVIPREMREELGISSGDKLVVERLENGEAVLKKAPSYHDLIGIAPALDDDPVERIRKVRDHWR